MEAQEIITDFKKTLLYNLVYINLIYDGMNIAYLIIKLKFTECLKLIFVLHILQFSEGIYFLRLLMLIMW
jgi:hypothetical protein